MIRGFLRREQLDEAIHLPGCTIFGDSDIQGVLSKDGLKNPNPNAGSKTNRMEPQRARIQSQD
jgi:hypothetical protein